MPTKCENHNENSKKNIEELKAWKEKYRHLWDQDHPDYDPSFLQAWEKYLGLTTIAGQTLKDFDEKKYDVKSYKKRLSDLYQDQRETLRDLRQDKLAGPKGQAVLGMIKDEIEQIKFIINSLEVASNHKKREPIATAIKNYVYDYFNPPVKKLSKDEINRRRSEFWNNLIDHVRFNFFSLTSFFFDSIGNLSAVTGQLGEKLGRDLGLATKGELTFPNLRGMISAIRQGVFRDPIIHLSDMYDERGNLKEHISKKLRERLKKDYPELHQDIINKVFRIEEDIAVVSGEQVILPNGIPFNSPESSGIFTTREGFWSRWYDNFVGFPMYAKLYVDNTSKRIGALASVLADANVEASSLGLTGQARRDFIENFMRSPNEEVIDRAVDYARDAGFDVDLADWKNLVVRNPWVKLTIAPFGRWGFQFWRWGTEMLGYNRKLLSQFKKGEAKLEDFSGWLAKSATGWGALLLLNLIYDDIDFETMEHVDEDGNRMRIAGRDPLPTGLFLLSLIRGDWPKATGAFRYTSLPGAQRFGEPGEGGIIFPILDQIQKYNADPSPSNNKNIIKEFTSFINKALPGQAVLSSIASVIDPQIREGLGGNLPGVSYLKQPVLNPVTGKPLEQKHKLPGVLGDYIDWEIPTIQGAPIPFMTRIIDPAYKILSRYDKKIYRGPQTSLLGYTSKELPEEIRREWITIFGQNRHAYATLLSRSGLAELLNETKMKELIDKLDLASAQDANNTVHRQHGIGPTMQKIQKKLTVKDPSIRGQRAPTDWNNTNSELFDMVKELLGLSFDQEKPTGFDVRVTGY